MQLLTLREFNCCIINCTIIHRYPIFSTRYSVMCKVYTGYSGTSEIEHGLCACTVDNPLTKTRGLSLRTGAQTMLYLSSMVCAPVWSILPSLKLGDYLSVQAHKPCSISHLLLQYNGADQTISNSGHKTPHKTIRGR